MIAIGCCYFNDPEGIKRLLDSCWKKVDLCFMIDGRFKDYYDNLATLEEINQQSLDIINTYPNVVYRRTVYMLEHEKRQIYLDLCEEFGVDTLIIIDSDEYFHPESDWSAFIEERKRVCNDRDHLYNIKNYTEIDRLLLPLDQPRLIHFPNQIHYLNGHHYQLAINGTDEAITAKDTLYSVKLCHDPHLRSQERKDKHDEYIKWLKRYEAEKMLDETPKEKENRLVSVWSGN